MNHTTGNHKDFSKNLLNYSKNKFKIQDEFNFNYFIYSFLSNNNEANDYFDDDDEEEDFEITDIPEAYCNEY